MLCISCQCHLHIDPSATGLFTDQKMYRHVLAMFYLATKEMELKIDQLLRNENCKKSDKEICEKIQTLGYRFAKDYERDLKHLFGDNEWENEMDRILASNRAVADYVSSISQMTTSEEVCGAVFCLWGALIIGGGAMAMPKVKRLVGDNGVHVFQQVVGPGREERKRRFISTWDSLASKNNGDESEKSYQAIRVSCEQCMQRNHKMLTSVTLWPWWLMYLVVPIGVGLLSLYPANYLLRDKTRS